jgi:hypothetical protein
MAKFTVISTTFLVMVVMMGYSASAAFADAFDRSASVNVYNEIAAGETVVVDCMKGSKHRHIFTPTSLAYGEHLGWGFTPDFWGTTKYDCDVTWLTHFRRIRVWEDTYWIRIIHWNVRHCMRCVWHVTKEGFWCMTSDIKGEKTPIWSGGWST